MKYTELDKAQKVKGLSQNIGFFLEWLLRQFTLCQHTSAVNTIMIDALLEYEATDESASEVIKQAISNDIYEKGGYMPYKVSIQELLASYFEIDLQKLEEERRHLILSLREDKEATP